MRKIIGKRNALIFYICFSIVPYISFTSICVAEIKEESLTGDYEVQANPEKESATNVEISANPVGSGDEDENEDVITSWPDRSVSPAANAHDTAGVQEKDVSASAGVEKTEPVGKDNPLPAPLDHKERLKQNVSVSFKDMELKQALSILAETYDLNILASDDVKGNITINFKDVSLSDALTQMLNPKNFTYKWEGNIIKVISSEEAIETQIYSISHINLDLAKEIIADKISKDGKVRLNAATNQLIVTDTITKQETIKKILEDVDIPPAQVRIETKLIDISHTDLDNLGVKWQTSALTEPMTFIDRMVGRKHKTKLTQADYVNNTGSSADLTAGQFVIAFSQGSATVTATIDALIRGRKARIIANPAITALNNVEARITIGEKYPIREQTQTSTGTLETTRFVDVGTTLKVTPKINHDNTIQLTIHPEVSSVASTITDGPRITTREADTTVIVKDGDTLIMAGLLSTNDNFTKTRIPVLGYLPIIGMLFSSQDKDKEQKELVIFMTPHILNRADKGAYEPKTRIPSEIELSGEKINMVEMFNKAEDLERGESIQTKVFPPQARFTEAAKTYERVASLYPASYYAEVAFYRAAQIYEYKLKEYESALSCYAKIVESYPKSEYLARVKNRIKKIEKKLSKK